MCNKFVINPYNVFLKVVRYFASTWYLPLDSILCDLLLIHAQYLITCDYFLTVIRLAGGSFTRSRQINSHWANELVMFCIQPLYS